MGIVKFICMFVGVWFTLINGSKLIHSKNISSANFLAQAIGISGFVYIQWFM